MPGAGPGLALGSLAVLVPGLEPGSPGPSGLSFPCSTVHGPLLPARPGAAGLRRRHGGAPPERQGAL